MCVYLGGGGQLLQRIELTSGERNVASPSGLSWG